MTPKFKGVADAMKKLAHELDADAEALLGKVERTHARRRAVFGKANERIDGAHAELGAVDGYLDEIEKSNAGPAGPLPEGEAAAPAGQEATPPGSSKAFLD